MVTNNTIQRLQNWFSLQCDADWEHTFGISITTMDNPGWHVKIDLVGTVLQDQPFQEIKQGVVGSSGALNTADWINCKKTPEHFEGIGDSSKLEELLEIFLNWAEG